MNDIKKMGFILPNTLTGLNIGCGFLSILSAAKGDFHWACILIFIGAVFDLMDGRIARLTGTSSVFGEQFDSLSDLITFGIAPSFIFYYFYLRDFGRLGVAVCFLYLLCGALRLARFNANIDHGPDNYFQGLPIPGAAAAVMSAILVNLNQGFTVDNRVAFSYILLFAILMITNIPFPSFKKSDWIKNNRKIVLLIIFLLVTLLFVFREFFLLTFILFYVVASLVYFVMNRKKFKGIFDMGEE